MATEIGWALIGCGDIARKRVAAALRDAPGGRLVSVSRARALLAEEFAREAGASKHFEDWREQIRDPDVGAVYVATPVDVHAQQTIAAAEAGKHVLCEKPMALAPADCDRMIHACEANGVRLGVAYYRRFYPVVQRIRELLELGTIGDPALAQVNAFERFDRREGEPRAWLLDRARSGGGPMMDFGSHRIEVLLHLFGTPESVSGWTDRLLFERREVEDTAGALFRFPGGVRAQLTVSHAPVEPADTLDIYGVEGSFHVPALNRGELRIVTEAGDRVEQHPPHANLHQPLVEDFLAAVRDNRQPEVDGYDGRAVQKALEEIYRA